MFVLQYFISAITAKSMIAYSILVDTEPSKSNIGPIAGGIGGVVVAIVLIVILVIFIR